jgi:hypothetical protein
VGILSKTLELITHCVAPDRAAPCASVSPSVEGRGRSTSSSLPRVPGTRGGQTLQQRADTGTPSQMVKVNITEMCLIPAGAVTGGAERILHPSPPPRPQSPGNHHHKMLSCPSSVLSRSSKANAPCKGSSGNWDSKRSLSNGASWMGSWNRKGH